MAGHSDTGGFWLLGDVPTQEVQMAVQEALARMKAGEEHLAVHPNCGTNFVTSGIMAGSAAFVGMLGAGGRFRDKLERLPLIATLATLALMVAQPVGLLVQERVTTSGRPKSLEVVEILPNYSGKIPSHRVITRY